MSDPDLIARLKAFSFFAQIPSEELEWIKSHSQFKKGEIGEIAARKGERIEDLWIVLSGHLAIHVDSGAGLHRVMEWRTGDVGGILPYSRMKGPPGDTCFEKQTELLLIHERHFPEMICQCPVFTAGTVHIMLDRARAFKISELQDEKMISLGKLAAGLAHELNNPASALVRSAKTLLERRFRVAGYGTLRDRWELNPGLENCTGRRCTVWCASRPAGNNGTGVWRIQATAAPDRRNKPPRGRGPPARTDSSMRRSATCRTVRRRACPTRRA